MTREERNEYQKEYNKNSESYREYQKNYYEENKEKWREYKANKKSYYIYMFLDENENIQYVGKTFYLDSRMSLHKSNRLYWEEFYTVLYVEFDGINDAILEDIEYMLIEVLQPVKNTKRIADYDGNVDKYLNKINWKEYVM